MQLYTNIDKMQLVRVALLLSVVGWSRAQATLSSPCPGVFQYEGGERGRWYGIISLPTKTVISSLWLNLVLDSKAQNSWTDDAISENVQFKIEHIKKKTYPAPVIEVRFYVNHNSDHIIPRLAEIRLNNKEICNVKNKPLGTAGKGTRGEEGTFYWIKLVGSQETKPAISGLSSPVDSLAGNVPPAYNEPQVNSWLSYITGPQSAQPSPRPALLPTQQNPQGPVEQNWAGGVTASDSKKSKIKHINMGIFPIPGTSIEFQVHYNPNLRVSTVTDIRLNGKEICNVESIQPASNTQVYKRGIFTTTRNTTPKFSWLSYIGRSDSPNSVSPSRSINTITSRQTPTENFSPLGNSARPYSESWLSYITVNKQAQRNPWPVQPTSDVRYPTNSGSLNQQQPNSNSWMTYITGPGSPRAPSQGPMNQPNSNSWVSYISGGQQVTPSPPTQKPSYPVDQSYNTEFEIEDVEMRIYPAPATDIWFHVQYNPSVKIPKAVEIKLNGRDICSIGISTPSSLTNARGAAEANPNDYY